MTIFNSLGSNYDFSFVLKALFTKNKESYKEKLIKFLENKYEGRAILLYKGREAISLALNILNLSKDAKVAINGFTCFAVYKAIDNEGLKIELLDLDSPNDGKFDLNFSAELLGKAIKQNPKIKVVIIQNTLGYPCDIEGIAKVCAENNLILIEDLAHSVGAQYENGKEAGTIGDFVVLSFSQDKIIDAVSGGALIIRSKKYQNNTLASQGETLGFKQQLLDRFYPLFTFKIRTTYMLGFGKLIHFALKSLNLLSRPMNEDFYAKYNLPNWYSYLVLENLKNLNKNLEHRRKIATIYSSTLNKKIISKIIGQNIQLSSNLRFPIFVEKRHGLINYLRKHGVYISDIWYDDVSKDLPNCQIAAKKILNLPTHINVSEKNAESIAQKINQFFRHSGKRSSALQNERIQNLSRQV